MNLAPESKILDYKSIFGRYGQYFYDAKAKFPQILKKLNSLSPFSRGWVRAAYEQARWERRFRRLDVARATWPAFRARSDRHIVVDTYFPRCQLDITCSNGVWQVKVTNGAPDKIPTSVIHDRFAALLQSHLKDVRDIRRGRNIDFRLESIPLENWRDIWGGRIEELITDESPAETACLGSFGALEGNSKPGRRGFITAAQTDPDCFEYVETDKFSTSGMTRSLTLIEVKRRFKYMIDLPGHTYSTKLYWMLFTRRPIFLVPPRMAFQWEQRLRPWIHYIPVSPDFSDLRARYDWAQSHPDAARAIADRALAFGMSEMSPAAVEADFAAHIRRVCTMAKSERY